MLHRQFWALIDLGIEGEIWEGFREESKWNFHVGGTLEVVILNFSFNLWIVATNNTSAPPHQVDQQLEVLHPFLSLKVALLMWPGFL